MRQKIKVVAWSLAVLIVVLLLIVVPIMTGASTSCDFFKEYYSFISGVIGGIITLFALSLQFHHDRQREYEAKLADARCFFRVGYLNNLNDCERKKIKPYVCGTDSEDNNIHAGSYLTFLLKSQTYIWDCNITLMMGEKEVKACFGVVVPGQFIGVPVDVERNVNVEINYKTQMGENLVHKLEFDDIRKRLASEEIYYGFGAKRELLVKSQSKIFSLSLEDIHHV